MSDIPDLVHVTDVEVGHRLDNSAHGHAVLSDVAHKTAQAIGVRRCRELLDQLAVLGKQADVEAFATEI